MLRQLSLLLLVALLQRSTSQSDVCSSCLENVELDFFRTYTSISKQKELVAMPLNEAPRTIDSDINEPSFEFAGSHWLRDDGSDTLNRIVCGMCTRHEVTFHASLFFLLDNKGGPLINLAHKLSPVFSINVSPNGNTISIGYLHRNKLVIENISFKLEIGKWYKTALHFSGNLLKFFVNCELVESRQILVPDYCVNEESVTMTIGKDLKENYYNGSLQSVRVVASDSPLNKQCTDIEPTKVDCPVCGAHLSTMKRLETAFQRVSQLETEIAECNSTQQKICETNQPKPCTIDSVIYGDGEFAMTWDRRICFCKNGEAHCIDPSSLTPAPSPSVAHVFSTVAPKPTSQPLMIGSRNACGSKMVGPIEISLFSGETDYTKLGDECIINSCTDSKLSGGTYKENLVSCSQVSSDCLNLTTEEERNKSICCDHCLACLFATCPENSECLNVPPDFECRCEDGFEKSGDICVDVNECSMNTHNCPDDSTCENTVGNFNCLCPEYYTINIVSGIKTCVDIDECSSGTRSCPVGTTCKNRDNGFDCNCISGYELKNGKCIPVCNDPCKFGDCASPNNCTCHMGYQGKQCDEDIDECKTLTDPCHTALTDFVEVTTCVNTFGGYFCRCIMGMQRVFNNDGEVKCLSIKECNTGLHLCPEGSKCIDDVKGYTCECPEGDCTGHCRLDSGDLVRDGYIEKKGCDLCSCKDGKYNCERAPCNCSSITPDNKCCPQCSRKDYCFGPNGLSLKVGDHKIHPENSCLVMSCKLNGFGQPIIETSNFECSPLNCALNKQYIPTGTCCPMCTLPSCTEAINGRVLDIKNNSGCEKCECNDSLWTCNSTCANDCPSLDGCPPQFIASLTPSECPVCIAPSNRYDCSSS